MVAWNERGVDCGIEEKEALKKLVRSENPDLQMLILDHHQIHRHPKVSISISPDELRLLNMVLKMLVYELSTHEERKEEEKLFIIL